MEIQNASAAYQTPLMDVHGKNGSGNKINV